MIVKPNNQNVLGARRRKGFKRKSQHWL